MIIFLNMKLRELAANGNNGNIWHRFIRLYFSKEILCESIFNIRYDKTIYDSEKV